MIVQGVAGNEIETARENKMQMRKYYQRWGIFKGSVGGRKSESKYKTTEFIIAF